MLENYEDEQVKKFIIIHYNSLLETAVEREDYETAAKYKKWIKNLENIDKSD